MNSRINIKYLMLAIILIVLAATAGWLFGSGKSTPPAQQTASQPAATAPVALVNGVTVVTMDAATQIQNGIRADSLTSAENRTENHRLWHGAGFAAADRFANPLRCRAGRCGYGQRNAGGIAAGVPAQPCLVSGQPERFFEIVSGRAGGLSVRSGQDASCCT